MIGGASSSGRPHLPRTVLEYLLQEDDRSHEQFCRDFEAKARELGIDVTLSARHLRRLAAGDRGSVSGPTRRVLQAMFGRPMTDLLTHWGEQEQRTARTPSGLILPTGQPGLDKELIDMAASRARRFALSTGQTGLTAEVMDHFQEEVRSLAQDYPQRPLSEVLGHLVDTQDGIYQLLEQQRNPTQARQLYFLAGITGGLLAKASHDLANPHAATTQARAAYVCAEQADHDGLRAWIRGLQALITYWSGHTRESVRLAQQGGELAARAGGTASVWLPVSEARAWAALGNAEATRAAIRRAEDAWDSVREDEVDELGGLCTFGRARQIYYAADALSWLPGESDAAQQYAGDAVAAYQDESAPEWAFGDQAGSRADLAIARIAGGEVEGAEEALAPVLDLDPEHRINGIVHSVMRVHGALRKPGLGAAGAGLQEQIELFARTPLKALPQ